MPTLSTLSYAEWQPIAKKEGKGKHDSITWADVLADDTFAKYLVIRGYSDPENVRPTGTGFMRNPKGMAIEYSVISIGTDVADGPY